MRQRVVSIGRCSRGRGLHRVTCPFSTKAANGTTQKPKGKKKKKKGLYAKEGEHMPKRAKGQLYSALREAQEEGYSQAIAAPFGKSPLLRPFDYLTEEEQKAVIYEVWQYFRSQYWRGMFPAVVDKDYPSLSGIETRNFALGPVSFLSSYKGGHPKFSSTTEPQGTQTKAVKRMQSPKRNFKVSFEIFTPISPQQWNVTSAESKASAPPIDEIWANIRSHDLVLHSRKGPGPEPSTGTTTAADEERVTGGLSKTFGQWESEALQKVGWVHMNSADLGKLLMFLRRQPDFPCMLVFEDRLTNVHRAMMHSIARREKLESRSYGSGEHRCLHLFVNKEQKLRIARGGPLRSASRPSPDNIIGTVAADPAEDEGEEGQKKAQEGEKEQGLFASLFDAFKKFIAPALPAPAPAPAPAPEPASLTKSHQPIVLEHPYLPAAMGADQMCGRVWEDCAHDPGTLTDTHALCNLGPEGQRVEPVLQLLLDSASALQAHQAAVFSSPGSGLGGDVDNREGARLGWLKQTPRMSVGATRLLPIARFSGRMVLVTREEQVERALEMLDEEEAALASNQQASPAHAPSEAVLWSPLARTAAIGGAPSHVYGVDSESPPTGYKFDPHTGEKIRTFSDKGRCSRGTTLLQISSATTCVLFQLGRFKGNRFPPRLAEWMGQKQAQGEEDGEGKGEGEKESGEAKAGEGVAERGGVARGRRVFVGVALRQDLARLNEQYGLALPLDSAGAASSDASGAGAGNAGVSIIELEAQAQALDPHHRVQGYGLASMAAHYLGVRVSKKLQSSNWGAPRLSAAQLGYAATDAWLGRQIFLELDKRTATMQGIEERSREANREASREASRERDRKENRELGMSKQRPGKEQRKQRAEKKKESKGKAKSDDGSSKPKLAKGTAKKASAQKKAGKGPKRKQKQESDRQ